MYRDRIRRIGWSVFLLVCAAFGAGLLWRLTLARQTPNPPRVAEKVSRPAPHIQQEDEPETSNGQAINANRGLNKRESPSQSNEVAASPNRRQPPDEILIVGDPMRIVLPHASTEQPLIVRVKPDSQVTFFAPDSGKFPNGEIRTTIKADASGLAATQFVVNGVGEYRVLASSTENSRPALFFIQCVTKEFRDDLESGRYAQRYLAKQRTVESERQKPTAARVAARIRR